MLIATQLGEIYLARRGRGLPLLCVHGAGGNHTLWGWLARELAAECELLAPDLPGHFRSPGAPCTTVPGYGMALLALLDALELPACVLVGHSLGGLVALWMALQAPQRVSGLALLAAAERLPVPPALLALLEHDPQLARQRLLELAYAPAVAPELRAAALQGLQDCPDAVLRADYHAAAAFVAPEPLVLQLPLLLIAGSADQLLAPAMLQQLAARVPAAQLLELPAAGHMLPLERPRECAAALRDLLRRLKPV